MLFTHDLIPQDSLAQAMTSAYRMDETTAVNQLLNEIIFSETAETAITQTAEQLVVGIRQSQRQQKGINAILHQYDLASDVGIALMSLAEALPRIPDNYTRDLLISDKLSTIDWSKQTKQQHSLFLNLVNLSFILTGKIYSPLLSHKKTLTQLFTKASAPLLRPALLQGMKILGKHFVMGNTIEQALQRARQLEAIGYRYSYDMLGEAAYTKEDAERYFDSYLTAIHAIGQSSVLHDPIKGPGISIKLSALHPRYELANSERVMQELVPRLLALTKAAKSYQMNLAVDAEEANRLELSLNIIEKVFTHPDLQGWEGFGLAVQAYQKRAPFVIDWLANLAKQQGRRFMVRLVKGAYWDAEIKLSQVLGLEGYPVFTRKNATDVSYLVCAKKLLAHPECFYPQFGTHNAYSVAAIMQMASGRQDFEFQCLHGMGQPLYDQIVGKNNFNIPCRIYAPVGHHKDLLSYLVRRLLENGANTSFIHLLANPSIAVEKIIANPITKMQQITPIPHPYIPLPCDIYGCDRQNSLGKDLSNMQTLTELKLAMDKAAQQSHTATPIINGKAITTAQPQPVISPADTNKVVGQAYKATIEEVEQALISAHAATVEWAETPVEQRAHCLEKAADLFEKEMPTLMTLLCLEGGKQIADCVSEVREAIDFCLYYAAQARQDLIPKTLAGPTGELNQLSLHARGVIACISPWNFPLAIFIGQVVAALVTGNTVLAKPAEQTPLIAAAAVRILHRAGIPNHVLHLLIGSGRVIGPKLTADERVNGVMLTGSTETAKIIQQTLANRAGAIVPFIAETGGQNAMIADSSALPEQIVTDVIQSAFNSAGQRCSALRVLFLQEDIAPKVLTMLQGAMAELTLGDPSLLATDVGPVIDAAARTMLQNHFTKMSQEAKLLYQVPLKNSTPGHFFAPCVFELTDLSILKREVFGPILHVIRFKAENLDQVLDAIINTGYGLTLGIQSRIQSTIKYIQSRMPVGNIYVNRNMVGAVVGVQPFGGEGLSGTGPKAGSPYYLPRLCVERVVSVNTTAAGGNTTLVSLREE